MDLLLVWIVMIAALFVLEKQRAYFLFPVSGLLFVAAAFLLAVGDPVQASLLAGTFAAAVILASRAKVRLTGSALKVSDFGFLAHGDRTFLFRAYGHVIWKVCLAGALILVTVLTILFGLSREPIGFATRFAIFVAVSTGLIVAYRVFGGDRLLQSAAIRDGRPFSTFVASCFDIFERGWSGWMAMSHVAERPHALPKLAVSSPRLRPDIVVILHESTFDPVIYGLPVGPEISAFLGSTSALAGRLHVDCFAYRSWQSEFAFVTGLSALEFGPDNWRIFQQGGGRFRHTLPLLLRQFGYRTALASTIRSGYLNSDAFYRHAGVDRRLFAEDMFSPADRRSFERSEHDGAFYDAAMAALDADDDGRPRFIMLHTNYNHAPHHKRRAPRAREADRAVALDAVRLEDYGEYYARLVESAACYAALKRELAERNPDRPIIIVRYGDHQPALVIRLMELCGIAPNDPRQFQTFYAIECLNFELAQPSIRPHALLDLAFLGTVLLETAGLPLDAVFSARAALMAENCETYFDNPSPMKADLHRALIDTGLIRLA